MRDIEFRINLFSLTTKIRCISESTFYLLITPFILIIKLLLRKPSNNNKVLIIERILRIGDTITAMPAIDAIEGKFGRLNVYRLISDKMKALVNVFDDGERKILWEKHNSFLSFMRQIMKIRMMNFSKAYLLVTDRMSAIFAMLTGISHTIGFDYNRRGIFLTESIKPPDFINRPAFAYKKNTEVHNIKNVWLNLIDRVTISKSLIIKNKLILNKEDILWVEKRIGYLKRPIVILHPTSASTSKLWYKERWIELGKKLLLNGFSVVITAGVGEAGDPLEISHTLKATCTIGETSIPKLIALINYADAVISLDTAIGHISALLNKPSVVLFGSSDERIWKPDSRSVSIVMGKSNCIRCKKSKCFQKERYCMKSITVDIVLEVFFNTIKVNQQ